MCNLFSNSSRFLECIMIAKSGRYGDNSIYLAVDVSIAMGEYAVV
jgi:hypothetical protein